ncbi:GIY-YIG nuclease family protein [Leptolyngbya ohadii]|uniref:GIY-YIG nuclease family protein n=1 Tax=Leptolyngbya ohadii TaxID=1962290 RepID=UPI000B59CC9B|nr:GIY-YIG nuclease family protein [Leptolyngbya ohadii]
MHYVYILCCADGSLYTGYAKDVDDRFSHHNAGKGAKYTRSRLPVQLVAYWSFPTKSAALKEEYRIKQLTRSKKLKLVEEWKD